MSRAEAAEVEALRRQQREYRSYLEHQMSEVNEKRIEAERENRTSADASAALENSRLNAQKRRLAELNMRQSHILIG